MSRFVATGVDDSVGSRMARGSLGHAGMRAVIGLVVMMATAAADDRVAVQEVATPSVSFGGGFALVAERNLALLLDAEVGVPIGNRYWIVGALGLGGASLKDPSGSGQNGGAAYEARVGLAHLGCEKGVSGGCVGIVGSVGFHHQRIDFEDGLVDPPMWMEVRDLVFGEARALGRLQFGPAALEGSFGVRVNETVHRERTKGGPSGGFVVGLGLNVTI